MHSSKKGKQRYFGMKAHIGVDAESKLVHAVRGTSGNVSDIADANFLRRAKESLFFRDASYQNIENCRDFKANVVWYVAMRFGKRKALDKGNVADALIDQLKKLKTGVRAKVDHPFEVVKRQFVFVRLRYCDLKKNTAQFFMLFVLFHLWMMRDKLVETGD